MSEAITKSSEFLAAEEQAGDPLALDTQCILPPDAVDDACEATLAKRRKPRPVVLG